jgi:thiamine biosynthesis lipoprotein
MHESPSSTAARRGEFIALPNHSSHRLEFVMGMPVIVDVCDAQFDTFVLDEVFAWFHWVDRTFSTYRSDSAISRRNRAQLADGEAHPVVGRVLARCEELRQATDGYFDIQAPYRTPNGAPDAGRGRPGSVDPSGYVKGWAVAVAAQILKRAGAHNYAVNAGGDVHVAGRPDGCSAWRVGIENPREPGAVAITLGLSDQGIATSAAYARGQHIVDPHDGRTDGGGLLSVTITGPGLATADAYATAVFAMGAERGPAWCAQLVGGYEAVLIRDDDIVLTTPGIDTLVVDGRSESSKRTVGDIS